MVKTIANQTLPAPTTSTTPGIKTNIRVPKHSSELTMMTLSSGTILHRVHLRKYSATTLNPGTIGNARFSPITNKNGHPIPTIYAGSSMDCALMETVFHDVPHSPGFNSFDEQKLANHVHSKLKLKRTVSLIDLSSLALRRLGLKRNQLIDTEKDVYPATRAWACAVHRICEYAQGLFWVSRQDDTARAMMLFGDRLSKQTLEQVDFSHSLLGDYGTYAKVFDLAERISLTLTSNKPAATN